MADKIDVEDAATKPAQVTTDEGTVRSRSVAELIDADAYAKKKAELASPPHGILQVLIRPRGTYDA